MIKANSLNELEALLEKARKKALKVKPKIEIVETGHYKVEGSKGNFYDCFAGRNPQGEFFIACTCRAGLERLACFHAATVFYKHKALMSLAIRLRENEEMDRSIRLPQASDKKTEKIGNLRI